MGLFVFPWQFNCKHSVWPIWDEDEEGPVSFIGSWWADVAP